MVDTQASIGSAELTYDQRNRRANQMAHLLLARGVVKGDKRGIPKQPRLAIPMEALATAELTRTAITRDRLPVRNRQDIVEGCRNQNDIYDDGPR